MKRIPALVALLAILALAAAPAAAAPPTAGAMVAGSGWRIAIGGEFIGDPRVEFRVAAKFAGNATGTYQYANVAGNQFGAQITCGGTDAGVAVIGGHITSGNSWVGYDVLVFFVDNGSPTFGSLGPDQVSFTFIPEPGDVLGDDYPEDFPTHCPQPRGNTFAAQDLLTVLGDVVVH